jgi:predicted transcriptional regulator
MTGLTPFSIEVSDNFNRSFKKLAKVHRDSFVALITRTLEDLIDDQ